MGCRHDLCPCELGGGGGIRRLPPQGGPHTDGLETMEKTVWNVGVPPAGGGYVVGGPARGGYLRFPPP